MWSISWFLFFKWVYTLTSRQPDCNLQVYKFSLNLSRFRQNEKSSSETSTYQRELLRLKLSSQNEKLIEVKKHWSKISRRKLDSIKISRKGQSWRKHGLLISQANENRSSKFEAEKTINIAEPMYNNVHKLVNWTLAVDN